ncbi:hypothetical protein NMG60_11018343 [Bertholletia excelsa]
MGYENDDSEQAHNDELPEEMETVVLDEPSTATISEALSSDSPSRVTTVFRSFDGDHSHDGELNGHNSSGETSTSSALSTTEYLRISVSDPQKEQDFTNSLVPGGNTYYTYLVTTRTNIPQFGGFEFSVRRRFREFVTLSDRLLEAYRGFFVPVRPDKSMVEGQVMQKQGFLEQRRVELEKYLSRLAAHPLIKRSDELRLFLQVEWKFPLVQTRDVASRMFDGAVKLPQQLFRETAGALDPKEASQPARVGSDLLRIFKELRQSVANAWGKKPAVVEEDEEFLDKKKKVLYLEQQLSNVSVQAESLVKAQQDMGETMGELGMAFVKLTNLETKEATYEFQIARAADMKYVATAAVKASRLYRELNGQTIKYLAKLHEYLELMLAINNAFLDRSNALLTLQTLLSELSSLSSRIEKLEAASLKVFGGDRSKIRKIEELKGAITVTEGAKDCAFKEYEQIKENNKSELERLDKEKHNDFLGMLKGLIVNQAGYAEKIAGVWEMVAEETSGYAKDSS